MAHYARILATLVLLGFAAGGVAWRFWRPKAAPLYEERALLEAGIRARLQALRDEDKFHADETISPPYPGPKGPRNRATLSGWVDGVIDDILAEPDGPLEASDVAGRLGLAIAAAAKRPAADQTRLHGYLIEIWYILGYRSATGYFPAAEDAPEGWSEPLPPGWTAPDRPRQAASPQDAPTTGR